MACCVRAIAVASLLPGLAWAQAADSLPLPLAVHDRVAAAVAEAWNVPAHRVRLEWGVIANGAALSPDTPFRLMGRGTDGWFAVLFREPARRPVAVRLRAASRDTVPVATRALRTGATLAADDVTRALRERWGPPPLRATDAGPGPGWTVRRPVAPGDVLAPPRVAPPLLVHAGGRVRLIWSRGTLRVAIEGNALNGAPLGGEVRVRLDDGRGRATGIVTGVGVADLVGRNVP